MPVSKSCQIAFSELFQTTSWLANWKGVKTFGRITKNPNIQTMIMLFCLGERMAQRY